MAIIACANSREVNPMLSNSPINNFLLSQKEITRYADLMVFNYVKKDKYGIPRLHIEDLNVNDLDHFVSIIMSNVNDLGSEACGPDNEAFLQSMLPSLTKFMRDTISKDNQQNFMESWKKGVRDYHKNIIQDLLDNALENSFEIAA